MQHVYVSGPAGRRGRCVAGAPVTAQIPTAHSALSSCAHCVVKSAIHGRECRCGRVCARAAQTELTAGRWLELAVASGTSDHTRDDSGCVSCLCRHDTRTETELRFGQISTGLYRPSKYFLHYSSSRIFHSTQRRASAHSLHESVRDRDRAGDDHNAQRSNVECVNKVLVRFLE